MTALRVWQFAKQGRAMDAALLLGKKHHFNTLDANTLYTFFKKAGADNQSAYRILQKLNGDTNRSVVFLSYDQNEGTYNMFRKPVYDLAKEMKGRIQNGVYPPGVVFYTNNRFVYKVFKETGIDVRRQHISRMERPFEHVIVCRATGRAAIHWTIDSVLKGNFVLPFFY